MDWVNIFSYYKLNSELGCCMYLRLHYNVKRGMEATGMQGVDGKKQQSGVLRLEDDGEYMCAVSLVPDGCNSSENSVHSKHLSMI